MNNIANHFTHDIDDSKQYRAVSHFIAEVLAYQTTFLTFNNSMHSFLRIQQKFKKGM